MGLSFSEHRAAGSTHKSGASMDQPDTLDMLKSQYTQALQKKQQDVAQARETLQAYQDTLQLTKELPLRVKHNIMVPVGPRAYMPGQLIHTNEMMTLLGDGYFALRSAAQAGDIMNRRIEYLEKQVVLAREDADMLEQRCSALFGAEGASLGTKLLQTAGADGVYATGEKNEYGEDIVEICEPVGDITSAGATQNKQAPVKKKHAAEHTHDCGYSKWDSFDVEAEMER